MRRRQVHHSMNVDDCSESSEAECEVEKYFILFSDDENEEIELEETVHSVKSHEESLLDMAIDE